MISRSGRAPVKESFGPRAETYLSNPVPAEGEDFARLADPARGRPDARVTGLGCGGGPVTFRAAVHGAEVAACGPATAGFAVRTLTVRRLRLEFSSWIARRNTPGWAAEAIPAVRRQAPEDARDCTGIEKDGSFTMDTAAVGALPRG